MPDRLPVPSQFASSHRAGLTEAPVQPETGTVYTGEKPELRAALATKLGHNPDELLEKIRHIGEAFPILQG